MVKFKLLYDYEIDNEPHAAYVYLEAGAIVEFAKYEPDDDDWSEADEYVVVYHEDVGKFEVRKDWLEIITEE